MVIIMGIIEDAMALRASKVPIAPVITSRRDSFEELIKHNESIV